MVTVPGSEVVELGLELGYVVDKADEPGGMAAVFPEVENHAKNIVFVAQVAASGQMVDFVVRLGEGEVKVSRSAFAHLANREYQ